MKNKLLFMCMVAIALTACHKPEPEPNNDNPADTTETMVKKYLVKQLLNDDPEKIMLAIDWNDDFTRILHVKHGLGYGSILDYDFTYYGNDSLRIVFSMPQFSYPLCSFWYDSVMIHFQQEKIDSICCYSEGCIRHVERYCYNNDGRLIERTYLFGTKDTFQWDGDNVVKACILMDNFEYSGFTQYIHPHYNLPFYLSNYVSLEVPAILFKPLWKNMPVNDSYDFEADEDNYVIKAKSRITQSFHTYYYKTNTNNN